MDSPPHRGEKESKMMAKKTYADDLTAKLNAASGEDVEKKRLMLYLDPAAYDRLKAFCGARKLSMNRAAIIALETMLDHVE